MQKIIFSHKLSNKKIKLLKKIGMNIGEIFQISDDFNDEPKMSTKEKKYLDPYKLTKIL